MLSLNFTLVLRISKCFCFTSKQDLSQMLSWNHRDIAHCRVEIHFRDAFQRRQAVRRLTEAVARYWEREIPAFSLTRGGA